MPLTKSTSMFRISQSSRVTFVSDNETAFGVLTGIADAMKHSEKRMAYFRAKRRHLYIPDESGVIVPNSKAAITVGETLSEWAQQFGLPKEEESVLMAYLKTLESIATADDEILEDVPIEEATKKVLHWFFGSQGRSHEAVLPNAPPPGVPPALATVNHYENHCKSNCPPNHGRCFPARSLGE